MGDGMGVRFMVCLLCSLASPAAAVVGGAPAAPPEPDAAVVFVQRHGTAARIEGIKYDALGYYTFLGIRYSIISSSMIISVIVPVNQISSVYFEY